MKETYIDPRMTKARAAMFARAYGLKAGDLLRCCGESYRFSCFGGIDDGMPWVYGYHVQKNGLMQGDVTRLCVWRRVNADGSLGKRCPRGVERRAGRDVVV